MDSEKQLNQASIEIARQSRLSCLRMIHAARASHIGSSFSAADLLAVLYSGVLRIDPKDVKNPDRDWFIQSKGHGSAILYATLAEQGFIPRELLSTYCQNGSALSGHVTSGKLPGVEFSTGSLGHGPSVGCGLALAHLKAKRKSRVFVLMSDGECDEGSVWEAALFAGHHRLSNLVFVVDYNKIQSFGTVKEVLDLEPFSAKWSSFGWSVREIDGHDHGQIRRAFMEAPWENEKPSVVIAHTIKGKGVSFMENDLAWHYRSTTAEQLETAIQELALQEPGKGA